MHSRLKNSIHHLNGVVDTLFTRKIKPFLFESGRDCLLFFRKITRSPDISKRKIFADIDNQVKKFESEEKEFFSRLNIWLLKNPEYSHPGLNEFDAQTYSGENILVISPHPDDEMIGCGGTLIQLIRGGARVSVVQVTDGSNTAALKDYPENIRKTVRLDEAQVVATDLGVSELFLFREPDGHLACTGNTVEKLSGILDRLKPKIIFIPFMNDTHSDHIVANEILGESLKKSSLDLKEVQVSGYEVWSLVPPNMYCSIDNQFDRKADILRKYRTPMKLIDYVHFCESLNAYHAYTLLGKKGFAEVFFTQDAGAYRELLQKNIRS